MALLHNGDLINQGEGVTRTLLIQTGLEYDAKSLMPVKLLLVDPFRVALEDLVTVRFHGLHPWLLMVRPAGATIGEHCPERANRE